MPTPSTLHVSMARCVLRIRSGPQKLPNAPSAGLSQLLDFNKSERHLKHTDDGLQAPCHGKKGLGSHFFLCGPQFLHRKTRSKPFRIASLVLTLLVRPT